MPKCKYPYEKQLKEGLYLILHNWPVLKLALQNDWSSQNNQQVITLERFVDLLYHYCIEYDIDKQYLQDYLQEFMQKKYNTIIEDGSVPFVSKTIMSLIFDIEKDSCVELNKLRQYQKKYGNIKVPAQTNQQSSSQQQEQEEELDIEREEQQKCNIEQKPKQKQKKDQSDSDDEWITVR